MKSEYEGNLTLIILDECMSIMIFMKKNTGHILS